MVETRKPIALAVAASVLGCGAPHLATIRAAKSELVGREASVLERCIGAPARVTPGDVAGTSIWTYASTQPRDARGLLEPGPDPAQAVDDAGCSFTFRVVDGHVASVTSDNRAGWGFGRITACSRLVERCVGRDETSDGGFSR